MGLKFNDVFSFLVNAFRPPIGSFGDLVFEVSTDTVKTYDNLKRESKARYMRHELAMQVPTLEYLGREPEEISFTMLFSVSLGVDPSEEVSNIRKMCIEGEADYLILGNMVVGDNMWVIESVTESVRSVDNLGTVLVTGVDVKMIEYIPGVNEF